jgi:hypothetical protein
MFWDTQGEIPSMNACFITATTNSTPAPLAAAVNHENHVFPTFSVLS